MNINLQQFIFAALDENLRLDGRAPLDMRDVCLSFTPNTTGSVEAKVGKTHCLAIVSSAIVKPYADRSSEGVINIFTDISHMATIEIESGTTDRNVAVSRLLERCIRESRVLDVESLCILVGEKVWSIRLDVQILNDDGNLGDCAILASIAALKHFRLPDYSIVGHEVTLYSLTERQPYPLTLLHSPVAVTFALFKDHSLIDPCRKEELVQSGSITIAVNEYNEVCCIHKPGGLSLDTDMLLNLTNIAMNKGAELVDTLIKAVDATMLSLEERTKRLHCESKRCGL